MRQRIIHGAEIDAVTPDELGGILSLMSAKDDVTHIRAGASVLLNSAGAGTVEVYKCPAGYTFELRRVVLAISTASDPYTGNVLFASGTYVTYNRSGSIIEYGIPLAPTAAAQIPGMQTWAREEGPIIANGEVFEVAAYGLTANAEFTAKIEGLLYDRTRR